MCEIGLSECLVTYPKSFELPLKKLGSFLYYDVDVIMMCYKTSIKCVLVVDLSSGKRQKYMLWNFLNIVCNKTGLFGDLLE